MTRPLVECTEDPAHVAQCQDCQLAARLRHVFRDSEGARAEDELLVARAVDKALRRRSRTRHVDRRAVVAAAALLLFAAGVASGSLLVHWRASADPDTEGEAEMTVVKRRHHHARGTRHLAPGLAASEEPEELAPAEAPPAELPPPVPAEGEAVGRRKDDPRAPDREPRRPLVSPPAHGQDLPALPPRKVFRARPKPETGTAAELFHLGLTARGGGDTAAAMATFKALERRFPESPEAIVSYVSLGTLLLDRGEPAAAVAAFNDYLQAAPYGDLAREALAGKRRALAAAGLREEAETVNRELEGRFPVGPSLPGDSARAP